MRLEITLRGIAIKSTYLENVLNGVCHMTVAKWVKELE